MGFLWPSRVILMELIVQTKFYFHPRTGNICSLSIFQISDRIDMIYVVKYSRGTNTAELFKYKIKYRYSFLNIKV